MVLLLDGDPGFLDRAQVHARVVADGLEERLDVPDLEGEGLLEQGLVHQLADVDAHYPHGVWREAGREELGGGCLGGQGEGGQAKEEGETFHRDGSF